MWRELRLAFENGDHLTVMKVPSAFHFRAQFPISAIIYPDGKPTPSGLVLFVFLLGLTP